LGGVNISGKIMSGSPPEIAPQETTGPQEEAPKQIAFDLMAQSPQNFETFFQSSCNEAAVTWLRRPRSWPSNILALIGDAGTGKTHLVNAFVQEVNGRILRLDNPLRGSECRGQAICVDNAQKWSEESLFILINMALNGDITALLLTDRQEPANWQVLLPDLRSRLKNINVVRLAAPDDSLLEPIIRKIFSDYGRDIDKSIVDYILTHCARDLSIINDNIAMIERHARAEKKDVTKRFVAKVLKKQRG